VLWRIAAIVHEADLEDEGYDAPEAAGLDVVLRGLSMAHDDHTVLALTGPVFDGLHDLLPIATDGASSSERRPAHERPPPKPRRHTGHLRHRGH
jgi:hypothetical protein